MNIPPRVYLDAKQLILDIRKIARLIPKKTLPQLITLSKRYQSNEEAQPYCDSPPLASAFQQIRETYQYLDTPYYVEAGFGKFWNEVPLPDAINRFFCGYVDAIKNEIPGLLGPETSSDYDRLNDNCRAISYFDLSGLAIVFDSEAHMREFAEKIRSTPRTSCFGAAVRGMLCRK